MENAARSRGLNPNQRVLNMAMSRKDAIKRMESLVPRVEEHIQKIIKSPNSRDVPHWQGEIKAWLDTMENAAPHAGKATSEEWLFRIRNWRLLLDASR